MTETPDTLLAAREQPGGSDPAAGIDADLQVQRVVAFAAGLSVLLVAGAALCWLIFTGQRSRLQALDPRPSPIPEANQRVIPPEPRLQRSPRADMEALLARENAVLSGWGWADEAASTVRIPIDRAIDLMAEKGARAVLSESGEGEPPPGGGGR